MKRLYLIGATVALVVLVWFNGANANIQLVDHGKVSNKTVVEHEEKAYLPCLNKRLVQVKEAFNGPMSKESAVANALSILRECDGHLIEIGSWLRSRNEPEEKIKAFMDSERNHYGTEMVEFLQKGLIAKEGSPKDEGSHHNHE